MTLPKVTPKNSPLVKTLRSRIIEIQPSTPTKNHEPSHSTMNSDSPFPSPDQKPDSVDSKIPLRRSSRLASISRLPYNDIVNTSVKASRRRGKKTSSEENGRDLPVKRDSDSDSDKGKTEEVDDSRVLDSKRRRLSLPDSVERVDPGEGFAGIDGTAMTTRRTELVDLCSSGDEKEEEINDMGSEEEGIMDVGSRKSGLGSSGASGRIMASNLENGKRKLDIDLNSPALDIVAEDGNDSGFLNLRSGARIVRRKIEGNDFDSNRIKNDGIHFFHNQREGEETDGENQERLSDQSEEGVHVANLEADPIDGESSHSNGGKKYSRAEKGKGILIKDTPVELDLFPVTERLMKDAVSGLSQVKIIVTDEEKKNIRKDHIKMRVRYGRESRSGRSERFRRVARENASRFAHFRPEEENVALPNVPERPTPPVETFQEPEDWPGPFSTAMKIIKDRKMKQLKTQRGNSSSGLTKLVPVIEWIPSKDQSHNHSLTLVPSLQDLCLSVLAKNSDAIVSLELVPDVLKHKLSRLICDSRKMNAHYLELLVSGSPTEIRVTDCSAITEEDLSTVLVGCKTENLRVLQLDLCGRCLPNYILRATLAQSPNSLPALATISLKGACRLSDVGLKALVSSAPALRSINLEQCSFLTLDGINILANSLGSVLRELYIDDCQNVDAMMILPALKKLAHLEVLSVACVRNVCDDFVSGLVAVHGPNMKKLAFSGCRELTDTSLKVIAENCSGLCSLDLGNLCKLTDCAIGYLANGCHSIHTLNLCRNAFSDEAIAAFLEASGESLTELWLNNVNKVGHHTAISLARCSRKLQRLDLSFCRKLTNEAVGLIVDSCSALEVLKLFGCTQIGNVFLDGHSNPHVQIIGLPMTSILKHLNNFDTLENASGY
ncbi:uncharacterized protein LOC122059582 [Macadamia integrifolia]|uniref:uncharacterized protein LOC122059582 n=1 Tax=Macadamia integrifolia TaxID=60698 RepID=UPI001C533153|nr:uncharacterized protein LOC122059582 [Macadamia integrifolia]